MPRLTGITSIGLQRIASHLASAPSQTLVTYLALGDDDTAFLPSDLALGNETYRVVVDSVFADGRVCFESVEIIASDIGAGTITIAEMGLYDAVVGGNLIARQVLDTAFTFSGAEKIRVLWGEIIEG
jgi:hypothetical protein